MRSFRNVFYCVTHSAVTLGAVAAMAFICAMFLRLDFRSSPALMLLRDPRPATWGALAVVAMVFIYDGENRIPTAAVCRGNSRAAYHLSRAVTCYLLGAVAYIATTVGAAIWIGNGIGGEFLSGILKTLPFCISTTALVLLLAVCLRSMMAYIAAAALMIFVLWTGLGSDIEIVCALFPPYMQLARELTDVTYIVCAGWVALSTVVGIAVGMRQSLK